MRNQFKTIGCLCAAVACISLALTAISDEPKVTSFKTVSLANKMSGDWPMWGGTTGRNMVNSSTGVNLDFEPPLDGKGGKGIAWTAKLGSQTYGNPVVAGGKVFVGSNNGAHYRPNQKGDKGCLLVFDEKSGEFLWQLTRDKLPQGRVNDWPEQGICSTATIEGNRIWVVTNRAELMCLDTEGFHDGKNDGQVTDEKFAEKGDADIIWSLDMIEELGVFPHNLATSSPLVYKDTVYILTSNGVDEAHIDVPSPRSPSFLAVNKKTGEVTWEDNSPFDGILHGQWSSPAMGIVNGQAQIYFPGGDGWLYAFAADAKMGDEPVWKFDLNPKDSKWELGGRGSRNAIIATPVFYENSVLLAVGQDPEHGEGVGHLYRIDATKKGDITKTGTLWHYGGTDEDGSVIGEKGEDVFRRTMSSVAIHGGLVYAADLSGFIHCIDLKSGKRVWQDDILAAIWGSPMLVDGHFMIGDEDGKLTIFKTGRVAKKVKELQFNSSIYSTPTIANGRIYVSDRSNLYAFDLAASDSRKPYGGKRLAIPGMVEAEHFDEGKAGEVYQDAEKRNLGVDYRGATEVDIEKRDDASNGHGIGWTKAGEWVSYSVTVEEAGTYDVEFKLSAAGAGGSLHLEIDGKDVSGKIDVPDTTSYQKYELMTRKGIQLKPGKYILKVVMDSNGTSNYVADIDYLKFEKTK